MIGMVPTVPAMRNSPADTDLGIGEIIGAIRRRIWVPVVMTMLAATVTIGALQFVTPMYSAEAVILIETQTPKVIPIESVAAVTNAEFAMIQSEAYVLSSKGLANRVISKLDLRADPEFNTSLEQPLENRPEPQLVSGAVLENFLSRLTVKPVEDSWVLVLNFMSRDRVKSATIANTLTDEYLRSRLEAKFESTRRAGVWLNERVEELRRNVELAEARVEQARRQYGLVKGSGATLTEQALSELSSQLIVAQTERAAADSRLTQLQGALESPDGASSVVEVLGSPLVQRLRQQQTELERQLAELSTEYGDLHPVMVQVRAEQADLENSIGTEINKIVVGLENEVELTRARERTLRRNLDELKSQAGRTNEQMIQVRALEREAEASRLLLNTLLGRQKETFFQEDSGFHQPDARVISQAEIPLKPSFPNRPVILGLVILASIFLGLLTILLIEILDRGFRSGEHLERELELPSLGIVPLVKNRKGTPVELLSQNRRTAYGEALRSLNWVLTLSSPQDRPKICVFTSTQSGEGKTTIAASLALSQAIAGDRTLLIEADVRAPSVHDLIGSKRAPGLVDYLMGDVSIEDAIHEHDASGLSIIPAGSASSNPPSLFASQRMEDVLTSLRASFDLIVIDSPPVMACADAQILGRYADTSVFVVRWGRTRRNAAAFAVSKLQAAGVNLAGGLLSMVDAKEHARYYHGDSGAYSGEFEKYYVA